MKTSLHQVATLQQRSRPLRNKRQQPKKPFSAHHPRRRFLGLAVGAAALPAVSRIARAQSYPTRPFTMIVPFAPGSNLDVLGRILAERMKATLGQARPTPKWQTLIGARTPRAPLCRLFAIGVEPSVRDAPIPRHEARKYSALALECGRRGHVGQHRDPALRRQRLRRPETCGLPFDRHGGSPVSIDGRTSVTRCKMTKPVASALSTTGRSLRGNP
jgi:hypothetical protein